MEKDLVGGVSVTSDDIRLWLAVVPRMDADSPRAAEYVRCWDVAGKIAHAKVTGQWPPRAI